MTRQQPTPTDAPPTADGAELARRLGALTLEQKSAAADRRGLPGPCTPNPR
ncbi:hypothetical protein ACRAWF_32665 [Streptomyces sp. L7]